jgi:hypothetical protein
MYIIEGCRAAALMSVTFANISRLAGNIIVIMVYPSIPLLSVQQEAAAVLTSCL